MPFAKCCLQMEVLGVQRIMHFVHFSPINPRKYQPSGHEISKMGHRCECRFPSSDNRFGPWFNIKMWSYQYRKSHCGDNMVTRSSYLPNRISYTGKMASLYWTTSQKAQCSAKAKYVLPSYCGSQRYWIMLCGTEDMNQNNPWDLIRTLRTSRIIPLRPAEPYIHHSTW